MILIFYNAKYAKRIIFILTKGNVFLALNCIKTALNVISKENVFNAILIILQLKSQILLVLKAAKKIN